MAISKFENRIFFHCDYCFLNITEDTFISCDDCDYVECIYCYEKNRASYKNIDDEHSSINNINSPGHNIQTHNFRIVSDLSKPCFSYGENIFTIFDELVFLNGLISKGIGNFEEISKLYKNKTEKVIKEHFFGLSEIFDCKIGEVEHFSPSNDNVKDLKIPKSDPNDSKVSSYMSLRQDFDFEIFNDYEMVISGLEFDLTNDSLTDMALKRHMLNYYISILKQRMLWRNYLIDRDLIGKMPNLSPLENLNIDEWKEFESTDAGYLMKKNKFLLQFISKNDYREFARVLCEEKIINDKISKLINKNVKSPTITSDRSNAKREIEFLTTNETGLLSNSEIKLCSKLNLDLDIYIKMKGLAIDCYIENVSLKPKIYKAFGFESENINQVDLFSDYERVGILYNWFIKNNIVID